MPWAEASKGVALSIIKIKSSRRRCPNSIFTIYKDNSGELWLGTHDAGPLKFNGKTFEKYLPEITLDN